MKPQRFFRTARWAFTIAMLFFLFSCKKNNPKSDIEEPEKVTVPTELVVDKTEYAPSEAMQMSVSDNAATQQEVKGKFGENDVKVIINGKDAFLLVPGLANGTYELKFSFQNKNYSATVKVKALTNVKGADFYASDFQDSIALRINRLKAMSESASYTTQQQENAKLDANTYAVALQDFNEQFKKLSPAEKIEFAQFVAANKYLIDELQVANNEMTGAFNELKNIISLRQSALMNSSGSKSISSVKNSMQSVQNTSIYDLESAQKEAIQRWLKSTYVVTRNIAKLAAILYVAPVLAGSFPILGTLAGGIAAGYMTVQFINSVSVNLEYLNELIDKIMIPYEGLTVSQISASATTDIYDNLQAKVGTAIGTYKVLTQSDENSSSAGTFVKTFITSLTDYRDKITNFLAKIPARFKPAIKIQTISQTLQKKVRSIHNKYFSVSNVSNPKVSFNWEKQNDGTLKFTASTNEKTDQTFTYDITYSNTDFSTIDLKKTISAKVIAQVDSTEIYKAAVVGKWTSTWFGSTGEGTVDVYDVNSFGGGQRTSTTDPNGVGSEIPDGDIYNTIDWSVYKSNNAYYFVMTFNNRNISFGGRITKYPKMEIKTYPLIGSTATYTILKKQ